MICVLQSCWGEKHGSNSLPKLDPIPPFPVFSLELTVPNTFAPPIPLTYRPMSQTHDPLCIWLLLIFICCPHAKMSRTQSAWPQLLTGLEETWPQGCVLCRDTPSSAQNMGRRVSKPATMPHPTSPLITARATKRSEANQTATQLPPPLPAGKTLGTGIVPGRWGVGNHGVRESSLPAAISTGFEGEHGTTRQHSPSSEGQLGHWVPVGCEGAGLPADPWRGKVA